MEKTVITVVGKDGVGIIAKVCNYLASNNVNILDISQTITGGFFNMMMVVDPAGSSKDIFSCLHKIFCNCCDLIIHGRFGRTGKTDR